MPNNVKNQEPYQKLIIALSIVIPLTVAILFKVKIEGFDFSFLPPIYASINGVTSILLLLALIAIKNGNRRVHETIMKVCIALSAAFLVMYVAYHMTSDPTAFGGGRFAKYTYYFILITHIILSIAVIPLVMFTFVRALSQNFDRHRKLAKITFPIWLYVAITGVVVYLMISPYYK
jgi:putative membrane protein